MAQSPVEAAVKVLVEFEDELSRIRQEAIETRKRFSTIASEEGKRAKKDALAEAQSAADERVATARQEAEREAASILAKGDESLKELKQHVSKRKEEAAGMVVKHLLGD